MPQTQQFPNILWIMADEFRTDSLSCYGTPFPQVSTPNMDRIAEAGVRFSNCFCNAPICVPSRTSEMTASLPEVTGVYGNEGSWTNYVYDRDLISFPEHFASHGYRTINLGKTHLPVSLRPWQRDDHAGADLANFFAGTETGDHSDAVLTPTLKAAIGGSFPGPVEFPGNVLTRNAVRWIETEARDDTPFLTRISYLQPHSPVLPPAPFAELYADLPWPDRIEGVPGSIFEKQFVDALAAHALTPAQLRRVRSDYYGLVAWLDNQIGGILDALERTDLLSNTIIVLEGDHGVSLGERGRLQKHTFFPETHRVPRLIAWQGHLAPGQVRADLTQSMDLAKTLCGLCQVPPAESFDGRNVFADPPPDYIFGTVGYGEKESCALPNQVVGRWTDGSGWPRRSCIRTARYRLDMTVRKDGMTAGPEDEDPYLADLALDPLEEINRADDPAYTDVLAELQGLLRAQSARAFEPDHVPVFSAAARGLN